MVLYDVFFLSILFISILGVSFDVIELGVAEEFGKTN